MDDGCYEIIHRKFIRKYGDDCEGALMIFFSQLNEIQIIAFGLILLRMSGFVFTAAILSSNSITVPLKILFSVVLTMTVYNSVTNNIIIMQIKESESLILMLALKEILAGVIIGFVTRIFFFGITMAGDLISVALGLGQAQIFNPMMGSMSNVVEQFFVTLATLLYLGLNGHHHMIEGLVASFNTIQLSQTSLNVNGFVDIVKSMQQFFVFGIQISAPVLISMLIVQVGIGILSRAVPQVNVLMTSASITILLGMGILLVSLPLMVMQLNGLLDISTTELFKFIKTL